MAGPAITTLLSPNPATGNISALTIGTETPLAAATSLSQGGTFLPQVDLSNMADGDVTEIRVYNQANSSSTLVEEICLSFANGQTDLMPPLPAVPATIGWKLTIKQTAGTARAYQWSVLNLNGT
ncbi:MAG: hypothetical protein WB678_08795 [Stellaceae bacterium]|jgi:hypothetical protein